MLEQIAVASAVTGERAGDLGGIVAAEDSCDRLLTFVLIDLADAHTAVEQAGMAVGGGLDFACVLGVLRVLVQATHQDRHQQMHRLVDFSFVDADLAGDVTRGNLREKIFKARHGPVHLTLLGWCGSGHDISPR